MPRPSRSYQLTTALVTSSVGAGVMCLASEGLGRSYRLHARRPGPDLNARVSRLRADVPSGAHHAIEPVDSPALIRVDILGPIEQRAGYHEPCGGWSDGHDAIADRLCAAFEEGDVLLVVDSPGGACAGSQQGIDRALRAKAKHARRVTVWANEMIGSAAMWWAAAVGDEIFLPTMGQIGSIGARGAHQSIAGALEKEGVVVTYFADPPDKIAFAPEFPLSPVGEQRGNRDVKIAADAFRVAVCGSPLGVRHGLTAEGLVELGADMLTGQAAVDAGLADGVASEDEVVAYALKMAERGAEDSSAQARARGGTMKTRNGSVGSRAEEPAEGAEDEAPPSSKPAAEEPGRDIPTACAKCRVENDPDAKYCKGCGASMATAPIEGEEPAEGAEDEAPPSSKPKPGASAPARMAPAASFAEIFGLRADASLPAQKAAAIDYRQVVDHAAKLTGQKSADRIIGALSAMADDAADSGRLRGERDDMKRKQARAERWQLARRLVALGVAGHERGKVFEDAVREDGTRVLDKDGKPLLRLSPVYAEMRLGTLRGLVEGYERNAPRRDPFQPDRERAEAVSRGARSDGLTDAQRLERAKKDPAVQRMFNAPGNTHSLDAIAAQHVKTLEQLGGAS